MIESKGHKITPIDGDLAVSRNAEIGGDADIHGKARVAGSLKVEGFLDAPNIKGAVKGLFATEEELKREYSNPRPGWCAIVLADDERGFLYLAKNREWEKQSEEAKPFEFIADSINVFASKGELADETQRAQGAENILTQRIVNETVRATEAENEIKKNAVKFNRIGITGYADKLELMAATIDGDEVRIIDIPAATETKAGVVSAEDKKKFVKSITWNNDNDPSNMNDFVVSGVYDIKGIVGNNRGNLPIMNTGENASFAARLVVTVSPEGDTTYRHSIGQTMVVSNSEGKETKVYTRNANVTSYDGGASYVYEWGNWGELQKNVNVDAVTSLDHLVDNGIYSGVLIPTGETFVLVVINNYAFASKYGTQKCISQFKYSVDPFGAVSFGKRVKIGNADFPAEWDILNRNEIDKMLADAVVQAIATVTNGAPEAFDTLKEIADWIANDKTGAVALANAISANAAAITAERTRAIGQEGLLNNAIAEEKARAERAEQTIKEKAVDADSLNFLTRAKEVALDYKTIKGVGGEITIPAATTESAGVMSAEDKKNVMLQGLENSFTLIGETSDDIIKRHLFFKNVRVEYTGDTNAEIDLHTISLSLLRKGFTAEKAEIRWVAAINGTRKYIFGLNDLIDFADINNNGYTHIEQENTEYGMKISYDVDLANPNFPRTANAFGMETEPTIVISRDRVNMAIENIIKEHLPETEINYGNLFDENKGHYIKLNQVVYDAMVVVPAPQQAADNWSYAVVDVVEGETYRFSAKGSLYVAAWAVVNSYGYVIEHSPLSASYIKDYTLIIPKNAVKLIVNCINQSPYVDERPSLELVTNAAKDIKTLTDKVNDINSSMQLSTMLKGKKILCLGDSITEGAGYDGYRYSDHIARLTGAVVYNCGSGGAHMEQRNELLDNPANIHEAYAAFDLPSVVDAIVSGNFSKQEAACEFLKDINDRSAVLNVIKSVVLSEIDVVTIFIGTNDYGNGEENLGAVGDLTPLRNSLGGFGHAVKTLLTANPNIRIYYFCPMVRYFGALSDAWDDSLWSDNLVNAQGVKFTDMVGKMVDNARFWKIPVCDMYNTLGINQYNIASVMKEDGSEGVHPKRGYRMIANKMASFILANNNLNV